jgi:molybdenum cofactor guanylyltransferase
MGADKALLMLGGQSLLDRTIATMHSVSGDVIVVGRTTAPSCRARGIRDEIEDVGPLGGLLSGLTGAHHRHVICVGCDQPFLDTELLRYLVTLAGDSDAVVPRIAGSSYPLHAVYARDITAAARERIETGEYSVRRFLDTIRVRWVDESEIDVFDPEHRSFLNVNTPEQWREVLLDYSSPCRL